MSVEMTVTQRLPRRPFRLAAVVLLAGVLSCVEGSFEPWGTARDDRVFSFLGGAGDGLPLISLSPALVLNDSVLEIDLRVRDAPLVSALAFEITIEPTAGTLDTLRDGTFFSPGQRATVVAFTPSSAGAGRWFGVVAIDSLVPGVGGGGVLGTVRVRRTQATAFVADVRFDTLTTLAYGPDGAALKMRFAGGQLVHNPRLVP